MKSMVQSIYRAPPVYFVHRETMAAIICKSEMNPPQVKMVANGGRQVSHHLHHGMIGLCEAV